MEKIQRIKEIVRQIDALESELVGLVGPAGNAGGITETADMPRGKKRGLKGEKGEKTTGVPKYAETPVGEKKETRGGSRAKVIDEDILAMSARFENGEDLNKILKEYGISKPTFYARRKRLGKGKNHDGITARPAKKNLENKRAPMGDMRFASEKRQLTREEFLKVKEGQANGLLSQDVASDMRLPIVTVNKAFGFNIYESYAGEI